MLMVSKPNDKNVQPLIGSVMHGAGEQPLDIPQLHVSQEVAAELLKAAHLNLGELQTHIDDHQTPSSRQLDSRVALKVETRYQKAAETWNVVGILPGRDPVFYNEFLVLGAHIDHVGNQAGEAIFPGANDNASGSAAVMEIAEAFMSSGKVPRRTVVFVLFSGGTIGKESPGKVSDGEKK